ncbi:hypothetical protein, unlikely [Trypanosoma brucei brucei TREU927]|uniref:Uncharacterized protein n=1 Tax=Trypanosoma brucei brucei (strain 927/4 GUTat10.1) TaxID=185431 RepID=Q4GYS9_TRYB2|nr:hypothetical protein, unlikely [Trypanosoma brucei brucei TREU927]CAJ16484.1 hypothetical protein, unlikely [Trypanosoma brucei brucei TREU927]
MARQRGEKWSACQPFCIAGARARVSAVVVVIVFAEFYSRRRESQTPAAVAASRDTRHFSVAKVPPRGATWREKAEPRNHGGWLLLKRPR